MITYEEFEQFYYKSFKIFDTERTPDEVGMTIRTAKWINRLSGKEVFDETFIEKLPVSSANDQLVEYYNFMLEELLRRNEKMQTLSEKLFFHVVVSDMLEISSNVLQRDAIIIVEWPFIKYIDLLNKETMYSSPGEFVENIEMLFHKFAQKYVDGQKVDKNVKLHVQYHPVVFKMCSYMRNIQELFLLGHELGHLMLRGSLENTEQEADMIAFEGIMNYCRRNQKLMPFILKSIMLLFTYMTWLDAGRIEKREMREKVAAMWQDRYDGLFEKMEPYYKEMDDRGKEEVDNCDIVCNAIERIGIHFMESL